MIKMVFTYLFRSRFFSDVVATAGSLGRKGKLHQTPQVLAATRVTRHVSEGPIPRSRVGLPVFMQFPRKPKDFFSHLAVAASRLCVMSCTRSAG